MLAGRGGTRVAWRRMPLPVRASVERRLGSRVEHAESQDHGFSPAMASRLALANGSRVFVKAIGPDHESGAPGGQEIYRREARTTSRLPAAVAAPGLIDSWDVDGWVVLVFEDIDGHHPRLPWRDFELRRVLDAMTDLSERLTPSPVSAPPAAIPGGLNGWELLASDPALLGRLPELDPWVRDHLRVLAARSGGSRPAWNGRTLLHTDLRADNIVLTDDRVMFVDWPHARIGAPWIDLLWFLPSVAMQGGPPPTDLFWSHPIAQGADADAVLAVLAGVAGFFTYGATQPPPPGLPRLRRFQLGQAVEAVAWLRHLIS